MQDIQDISIIPEPVSYTKLSGKFTLKKTTTIYSKSELLEISEYLKNFLFPATGFNLIIEQSNEKYDKENSINLKITDENSELGAEGYLLQINPKEITISAKNSAGIFYGVQTLRQLLPIEIESNIVVNNVAWEIPCLKIEDFPRFPWRGYMLDEARHFHGKKAVLKLLDIMALLKLNIFHWHLTDDQGWRIEIKKYPKLTEIGSRRGGTQIGGFLSKKVSNIPHSGYYTQEEIREIVKYAKDRFITIVPEIDLPGHTRALLASYPHLSCRRFKFRVSPHWGIHKDVLCIGKEEGFELIQGILDEIVQLFPSKLIHIGGDEVPKKRWKECPDCQSRLKIEGLQNERSLQVYFTNRIISYLNSKNCKVIGWNDILDENLKDSIIIQYWLRKKKRIFRHICKGGQVIMSNFKYTYLDHSYSFAPLKLAYNFEPIPKNLDIRFHNRVLGLEALMWSEFIPNLKRLEWQTFPRVIALAEIAWTPKKKKIYNVFEKRLKNLTNRFDLLKLNYAKEGEVNHNFLIRLFGFLTLLKEGKGGL
jgi:hexosaminidase